MASPDIKPPISFARGCGEWMIGFVVPTSEMVPSRRINIDNEILTIPTGQWFDQCRDLIILSIGRVVVGSIALGMLGKAAHDKEIIGNFCCLALPVILIASYWMFDAVRTGTKMAEELRYNNFQ